MTGISKRLRTSVGFDAINGDSGERAICGHQMLEAAEIIDGLHETKERLKAENAELRAAAQECLDALDAWSDVTSTTPVEKRMKSQRNAVVRLRAALAATEGEA